MKKYLICKKTIKLTKSFLAICVFLLSSYTFAKVHVSDNQDISVLQVNKINEEFCTVEIDKLSEFLKSESPGICDFLEKSMDFNKKINLRSKTETKDGRVIKSDIESASLAKIKAKWFNGDKSNDLNQYYLIGDVEDVYYNKNGRCYVAVNDNRLTSTNIFPNKYNKTFHVANNKDICEFAQSAFYLGFKVKMHAIVDKTENDYANNTDSLTIDESCP